MPHPSRPKNLLALCVGLAALAAHAPAQAPADAPARTLFVTVTDKQGNFVKGLRKDRFVVLDGKRAHEPAALREADEPATVGILVDISGSMSGKKVVLIRDALSGFLAGSHPANEYFVVAFNQRPQLLAEAATGREAVLSALDRVAAAEARGQTALYDALYLALERGTRGRHPKRVILVVTDGQDTASRYNFNELRRALAEGDTIVHALGVGGVGGVGDPALSFDGRVVLAELAELTGGRALFPQDGRSLKMAAEYLAMELRNQYVLSFAAAPSEKRGGWRELKVKLNDLRDEKGQPFKFYVHTRRGFYDETARRAGAAARP